MDAGPSETAPIRRSEAPYSRNDSSCLLAGFFPDGPMVGSKQVNGGAAQGLSQFEQGDNGWVPLAPFEIAEELLAEAGMDRQLLLGEASC